MNLKCPNCGGNIAYDPVLEQVVCESCKGKIATEDFYKITGRYESDSENIEPVHERPADVWEQEAEIESVPVMARMQDADDYMDMNIYRCSSCGAELMISGTEASTFCSYCGSSTIVFDRVSKEVRPQGIIPFKLNQEQALDSIKKHFAYNSNLPDKIKELTVDKVHAIYMPYWLFDTYIRRKMAVEVRAGEEGTFHYYRDASCFYQNVTLDGSIKLSNGISSRLEPFYTEEMVEFDEAYLAGYYADRYDVTKEALEPVCVQWCREKLDYAILNSCLHVDTTSALGYSNYEKQDVREEYEVENVRYALFPAYFVNLKYDKRRVLVIVNGQTGRVVGDLPYEKKRFVKRIIWNSLITCPIFLIFTYICLRLRVIMPFVVLVALVIMLSADGIVRYYKYKKNRQQMVVLNMSSYVKDRRDNI